MIETFHRPGREAVIPDVECEHCGQKCRTQIYTVELTRAKVTREWVFDTLECLRDWSKPVK